jgi:phosphatidylglycerol:prolipoprotein diacylglycerol transferase
VAAFGLLIGQAVGRWGNVMNREAYGAVTDVMWRMGITLNDGSVTYVHPTFLYESLWNILGLILLHFWSKKHRHFDGELFLLYLCWYGFGRFFIEGLRSDSLYIFGTGLRVSQLVAIVTFVASAILLIIINKRKNNKELYVNRVAAKSAESEENN